MNGCKWCLAWLALALLTACANRTNERDLLKQAEMEMTECPEKALEMVKNMDCSLFDKEERSLYMYLRLCTDTASLLSFATEESFDEAAYYFEEERDSLRLCRLFYEAGVRLQCINYVVQAQDFYDKAMLYVTADTDPQLLFDLKMAIGKVLNHNKLYKAELKLLEGALEVGMEHNDSLMMVMANVHLYQRMKELNMDEEAGKKLMEVRQSMHLLPDEKQALLYMELALVKYRFNQTDSLIYFLEKTERVCPDNQLVVLFCKGMRCYVNGNDSARSYLSMMYPLFTPSDRMMANRFVGDLLLQSGKREEALEYYLRHVQERDLLEVSGQEEIVDRIQGLREYRSQKNRALDMERRLVKTKYLVYRLLSAVLAMVVVVAVFYMRSNRKKDELKRQLMQAEHERIELSMQRQRDELNLLKEKEIKEKLVKDRLEQKVDYYKRLNEITIPVLMQNRTVAGTIHFSEHEWKMVRDNTNACFDNFTGRLKGNFPKLTEEEVDFCCLLKMELPLSLLAEVYHIEKGSVSRKKMRLKEKIGVENQSLDDFISGF